MPFSIDAVRAQFPSVQSAEPFVFLDNAAGAQVPRRVVDAVSEHLLRRNVQRGGPYQRSHEVDAMIAAARESVAALVNARSSDEIAFGLNATSFIRSISLAVGQSLAASLPRNEIVVSEVDHEANIAAWLALEAAGARIVWWRAGDDARLHAADLEAVVGPHTRMVACTLATNATGSIVDVAAAARIAHAAGAELFVDAVHYAPHGPVDVQELECDYLVCSGYKIFAPHMGFAWCRRESIARLPTYREHFIPDVMPDKLEAGTYGYESVAGLDAAISYIEDLGDGESRRSAIRSGMVQIAEYERSLSRAMLDHLKALPGVTMHGINDQARLAERVPTFAFTVDGMSAAAVADALAARDIGVRSGHMYSPRLIERLGVADRSVVRASCAHYNTVAEIDRFRDALTEILAKLRDRIVAR